jgi:hypothetical protein
MGSFIKGPSPSFSDDKFWKMKPDLEKYTVDRIFGNLTPLSEI